jgi:hypothetical protein
MSPHDAVAVPSSTSSTPETEAYSAQLSKSADLTNIDFPSAPDPQVLVRTSILSFHIEQLPTHCYPSDVTTTAD